MTTQDYPPPSRAATPGWLGTQRPKIYLAGKIRKNCWRYEVLSREFGDWGENEYGRGAWAPWDPAPWPVLPGAVLSGLGDYVGPYLMPECSHGCGIQDHGIKAGCEDPEIPIRATVRAACLNAIRAADIIFAYIDDSDCYGTLHELGYAEALGKPIALCFDPLLQGESKQMALNAYEAEHGEQVNVACHGFTGIDSIDFAESRDLTDDMWFMTGATAYVRYSDKPADVLRELLLPLQPAPTPLLESEAERRFWAAHVSIKAPELNGLMSQHSTLGYRLDFALPDQRVAIEIDGYAYHSDRVTFTKDRVRQRRLEMSGWYVIRFSGKEACDEPERCVREAAALIAARSARLGAQ